MNAPVLPIADAECTTSVFNVANLRCAGCIAKLEDGLARTSGVVTARVNFTTRRVQVAHLPSLDAEALQDAITRLGFPAQPFLGTTDDATKTESRRLAIAREPGLKRCRDNLNRPHDGITLRHDVVGANGYDNLAVAWRARFRTHRRNLR